MNRLEVDINTGESKVILLTQQEIDAALKRSAVEQAKQKSEEAKQRLEAIDRASIRALREWVTQQPGTSQLLKEYEVEAQIERELLRKTLT